MPSAKIPQQDREAGAACSTPTYTLKAGKQFLYSQNHLFIPAAGLGVAAYALYGEIPEAADSGASLRALYDRVLDTYSDRWLLLRRL